MRRREYFFGNSPPAGSQFPEMNRAVFMDRDGTLIVEKNYLHKVADVEVFPGAAAALKRLQDAGYRLIVVTNQAGVGRGYYTMKEVDEVNAHVATEFARAGVTFAKTCVAPEAPGQPSRGRKPSPQFLFDARDEFGLDLAQSYMIGDKLIDLECGWNAGVKKSLLVRTGYGAELERAEPATLARAAVVDDVAAAADWILNHR
jgi:D-glycero-D-manno-heptose 1,7-bisphosphate phosphatase